jgi:hypothetical protein
MAGHVFVFDGGNAILAVIVPYKKLKEVHCISPVVYGQDDAVW